MTYDAIIIGGGLSGLTSAIRLAHFGLKVRLFEKHLVAGGLNSYYRRQGKLYDVGLHAMTNWAAPDNRRASLNKLLRQLRLSPAELEICPQSFSVIQHHGLQLRFANDIQVLKDEVARLFPQELPGFLQLVDDIAGQDFFAPELPYISSRQTLAKYISSPDLQDMLLLPMMFYGNPDSGDMDYNLFGILFQSVFCEGLFRPKNGITALLDALGKRLEENHCQLSFGSEVRRIVCQNGEAVAVIDDTGERHEAKFILSSAGAWETGKLCDQPTPDLLQVPQGNIGFVETIFELPKPPAEYGFAPCIVFANQSPTFRFETPQEPVDFHSFLFCAPGNYQGCQDSPAACQFRMSHLANPAWWLQADGQAYRQGKEALVARQLDMLSDQYPEMARELRHIDSFTPKTIRHFTGKSNGAIYGSPRKFRDGICDIKNLLLIGTDQGFLGIVGSMMSGSAITNRHILAKQI